MACLAGIFIQDLRLRRIHFLLVLAVFALSVFSTGYSVAHFANMAVNALFLILAISLMVGYMSVRQKKFSNPFQSYFGLGDLLFYLAITPLFPTRGFFVFFVASLLFAIATQAVFRSKMASADVPLAGLSAVLLIAVLLFVRFLALPNLTLVS